MTFVRTLPLALALTLSSLTPLATPVHAADTGAAANADGNARQPAGYGADGVCQLIEARDLAALGIVKERPPVTNSLSLDTEQTGAPTRIHADLCFVYHGAQGARRSLGLTVERYEQMAGVAEWLERQNRKATGDQATLSKLDETTCEQEAYPYQSNVSSAPGLLQHALSCDRLVAPYRFALTLETPDRKEDLPSTGTLSAVLERIIARMK